MKRASMLPAMAALLTLMLAAGTPASAQEQSTTQNTAPNEVGAGVRF